MPIKLIKNSTILFQGNSITDCGRDPFGGSDMGFGYAHVASSELIAVFPDLNLKCINRGISGNCIEDLLYRWEVDCLQLKPDVVSILVGINDVWQAYQGINTKDNAIFYELYREILQKTKETISPQFILCEPFLLHVSEEVLPWREDLNEKISLIKKLAEEFNAVFVPYDRMFTEASKEKNPSYWAPDGVHPTQAGHSLMAKEWIAHVVNG